MYPVYGYLGLKDAQKRLKEKGYQLYKDGMLFYSSATLHLAENAKGGDLPAGLYRLRSLKSAGTAMIETHEGREISCSVRDFVTANTTVVET